MDSDNDSRASDFGRYVPGDRNRPLKSAIRWAWLPRRSCSPNSSAPQPRAATWTAGTHTWAAPQCSRSSRTSSAASISSDRWDGGPVREEGERGDRVRVVQEGQKQW